MADALFDIGDRRKAALAHLTGPGQAFALEEIEALGRSVRAFTNAPTQLKEIYAASRSDVPFLVFDDERLTFEDVWCQACTLAHALREQIGIAKGDRVAISMRNYPEWVVAFMAITSIGAVAVAMNSLWQSSEMDYALRLSGAKVLIADQERLEKLSAIEAPLENMAVITVRGHQDSQPEWLSLETLLDGPRFDHMPSVEVFADDDALMAFTSGSTGNPKGAVSTHRNVISALFSWELDAETAIHLGLAPRPPTDAPQGAILLSVPLFHVLGLHSVMLMCFRARRRLILMRRWDAEEAAQIIMRERATMFAGPPTTCGDLIEAAKRTQTDLSSLLQVGGGGASRAPEQVRAIAEVFGNAKPSTGWGMTETNAIGAGANGQIYLSKPSSAGLGSAVLDLRIVNEAGDVLPVNARGELQIRGTSIMRGYWDNPKANAEAFDGDWFRTGDVAYLDEQGFLFIVDRLKDLVIRGGENIGCGAVEAALCEHPDVIEACVYGVPDPRMGEEVAATLYVRTTLDEQALKVFLSQHLAAFQIPRYLEQRHEPLPRIATGKIFKRHLRTQAAERLNLTP